MKKTLFIYIIGFFCCFASCSHDKEAMQGIHVLDIEKGLNSFTIKNLSDYASTIRYIKLETDTNCLITQKIKNVFVEDNKIFVNDADPFLKVFDTKTGKYLYNIGGRGQGPEELPYLGYVDINPKEKRIILAWSKFKHIFDFEGHFLGNIESPQLPTDSTESISFNIVMLDNELFAAGVRSYEDHQINAAIIFDRKQQIHATLKSYNDRIQHPTIKTWSPFEQSGNFFRYMDRVHFYRSVCDTIYEYNPANQFFEPYLCFDFGKHRSNHNANPGSENKDLINARIPLETPDNIFIRFYTAKASPEPFEEEVWIFDQWRKTINTSIAGIYNKKTRQLDYLLQPIPGIIGLKNDIDNGIPFWSKNISSTNKLIDYHHAYEFLEYASRVPNPSSSFKKLVKDIDEEDNPVVIIAD